MQYALFAPIISEPGLDRGWNNFISAKDDESGRNENLHNYVTVQWCLVTGEVVLTSSRT